MHPETIRIPIPMQEHAPISQPDGFARDSVTERDLKLSACAQTIERALFEAMQAHAFGTQDHLTLSDMPATQREWLRETAAAMVNGVDGSRRGMATLRTVLHAKRWMESFMAGPLAVAEAQGGQVAAEVSRALKAFINILTTPIGEDNLVTEILDSQRIELAKPDTRQARVQMFKAALRGGLDV